MCRLVSADQGPSVLPGPRQSRDHAAYPASPAAHCSASEAGCHFATCGARQRRDPACDNGCSPGSTSRCKVVFSQEAGWGPRQLTATSCRCQARRLLSLRRIRQPPVPAGSFGPVSGKIERAVLETWGGDVGQGVQEAQAASGHGGRVRAPAGGGPLRDAPSRRLLARSRHDLCRDHGVHQPSIPAVDVQTLDRAMCGPHRRCADPSQVGTGPRSGRSG